MSNSNSAVSQIPSTSHTHDKAIMSERHTRLAHIYSKAPEQAWIVDVASTGNDKNDIRDPLHSNVNVAGFNIPLGVHPAVGGDGDAPIPGELLSAALASCMDSTIRVIANRLSISLTYLEVVVSAEVDVRGTLRIKRDVPVGFQKMHLSIDLKTEEGTKPEMVKALLHAAESSCVVMQTLKNPPEISTQINTSNL